MSGMVVMGLTCELPPKITTPKRQLPLPLPLCKSVNGFGPKAGFCTTNIKVKALSSEGEFARLERQY